VIERFAQILFEGGLTAPVRQPRGQDIMAACGQLKSASERLKKAAREVGVAGAADRQ
jgi:23S rRNA (adenine2503-C2)-methyltransferase